jgi:hypothetical protein
MTAAQFLKTRVSSEIKNAVQQSAVQQLLTESIWLRRAVNAALQRSGPTANEPTHYKLQRPPGVRLSVQLSREDRLLLRERAQARGMAAATYLSVLARSHLRSLPPLPREELRTLKRCIAELGAIGRNLNQIAKASNQGQPAAPGREDLRAILKVCEALRDHVKTLITSNTTSWDTGHG